MTGTTRTGLALLAAAVAFAGVAPDAEAQRLGRLFTTPEQRSTLDELRYQTQLERPEAEPEPEAVAQPRDAEPEAPGIGRVTINGLVRRSRGPGTVWVNGDQVERGGMSRDGLVIESDPASPLGVRLRMPSGRASVALKPGQGIDVDSGTVLEAFEQGYRRDAPDAFAPQDPESRPSAPPGDEATGPVGDSSEPSGLPPPLPGEDRQALLRRMLGELAEPRPEAGAQEREQVERLRQRLEQAAGADVPRGQ